MGCEKKGLSGQKALNLSSGEVWQGLGQAEVEICQPTMEMGALRYDEPVGWQQESRSILGRSKGAPRSTPSRSQHRRLCPDGMTLCQVGHLPHMMSSTLRNWAPRPQ